MSITAAYATAAEYRRVVGMTDAGLDAEIEKDLISVSRYIDGEMRRFFTRNGTPVARRYLPSETRSTLNVHDIAEAPTLVRVDINKNNSFALTLSPADYELLPIEAQQGSEPWPFTAIRLTPWGALPCFVADQRVEITAIFGWPQVPAAIQRATIHVAALLRLETPRATKRINELNENVETSHQAQNIVRQLASQYKVWLI